MAKSQDISLTPGEITGICGRLRCCLIYEHEAYEAARANLPKRKKVVQTPFGEGKVIQVLPMADAVVVDVPERGPTTFTRTELETGVMEEAKIKPVVELDHAQFAEDVELMQLATSPKPLSQPSNQGRRDNQRQQGRREQRPNENRPVGNRPQTPRNDTPREGYQGNRQRPGGQTNVSGKPGTSRTDRPRRPDQPKTEPRIQSNQTGETPVTERPRGNFRRRRK
jgi:hypothetical protein